MCYTLHRVSAALASCKGQSWLARVPNGSTCARLRAIPRRPLLPSSTQTHSFRPSRSSYMHSPSAAWRCRLGPMLQGKRAYLEGELSAIGFRVLPAQASAEENGGPVVNLAGNARIF